MNKKLHKKESAPFKDLGVETETTQDISDIVNFLINHVCLIFDKIIIVHETAKISVEQYASYLNTLLEAFGRIHIPLH